VKNGDGDAGYLHVTPADMPWVVSIGTPARPPKHGSRKDARRVAVEAMQMWGDAIRSSVPWFELEFVEDDPTAAVQVEWKRRITGPWAGFGGFGWRTEDGQLRVTGRMEVSTTPSNFGTLELDEVAVLFAHEFGHVLGLGHCLECDSAMNYAWNTRDRLFVTELDVRTFLALLEKPNAIGGFTTATAAPAVDVCGVQPRVRRAWDDGIQTPLADLDAVERKCLRGASKGFSKSLRERCKQGAASFGEVRDVARTAIRTCIDGQDVEQVLIPYSVLERDLVSGSARAVTRATKTRDAERSVDARGLIGRCKNAYVYCRTETGQNTAKCMEQQGCGDAAAASPR